MEKENLSPVELLEQEFNKKRLRNQRYSLRQFASYLEISPGRLSEILSRKRKVSMSMGERLMYKLNLDPEERKSFLNHITLEKNFFKSSNKPKKFHQLSTDNFYLVSEWHHFAILSIMELDDFKSCPKWIAKHLGLSVVQVNLALERLLRLNLIEYEDDNYKIKHDGISTTTDIDSVALKNSHKQSLDQAKESLDNISVENRDITSITMAVDSTRLKQAKKLIKTFRHQLCEFLETGSKKDQVYNLNVQLYPLTEKISKESKK